MLDNTTRLLGQSKLMSEVRNLVEKVAASEANVLILGETGTGKELVARSIHENSDRKNGPFVPINCGAIPAELLESELFGHEKGAFTGAVSARKGRFELAEGGTLFLDEIGDMPLDMQVKILRVLQEKVFERVGGSKQIATDVRIIAATHQNLESQVDRNEFRRDLYYRLNVFPIETPPLRDRQDDLPILIDSMVAQFGSGGGHISFDEKSTEALQQCEWEGNVRELLNVIERLSVLYPAEIIDVERLPAKYRPSEPCTDVATETSSALNDMAEEVVDLKMTVQNFEASFIRKALELTAGNVSQAAAKLSLRRTTLVEKIRKYDINFA
ncbi:MAG: sigma-54-dependent Fis family transcriptional regulator [Gammaproteobacteria bacterium]|jgi:sigma-54 specific flagellar transcriptional regulator A|nr:sigma-54-dependent Fis family transcriptional regulator [Gammaproteobacteria bacterium]MBT5726107.1 sigma-54-dependent Fis family transcriptional regulator [Gammaproteobacteria bacterium]MBT6583052.1 sigma-54-dependent Fis family transcriptional regulator [Gammaproteobacteria bacterium]MBT6893691.1 sigma-54-dependent Fis family transcriptional regulator [Gammaproteobacteria bacterium]